MKILTKLFTIVFLLSNIFIYAQDFELIPFRVKNKWGFSDASKKIKIKPQFQDVIPFNKGFSAYKENNKWGVINIKGIKIVSAKFDSISGYFQEYIINNDFDSPILVIKVFYKNEWSYVNPKGEAVEQPEIISVVSDDEKVSDYVKVTKKYSRYGLINTLTKDTIKPIFNSVKITNIGAIVEFQKKLGVYDINKLIPIIPHKYDSIIPTDDEQGFYIIDDEGKMGYYNKKGQKKLRNIFADIIKHPYSKTEFMLSFGKNIYGYMDIGVKPVRAIKPKYLYIGKFKNGYSKVIAQKGKNGYINLEGIEYFKR